ncbi:MAG: radical SAM protein [Roseiflexaceae bacterium]|nr:radical SAM protein [Roseiflexaceae bacterium]
MSIDIRPNVSAMVVCLTIGGEQVTISVKPGAISVMFGTYEVLTYDRGGRLWTLVRNGRMYRRGLNGEVLQKYHVDGALIRRRLSDAEAVDLIDSAAARMAALRDALAVEGSARADETGMPDEALEMLARAARFDAAAHLADRAAFARVYDPVGILPPDQYMAVVLQATEGCSFNTCTFCDFYRDRRFRIKSPDEFRTHAQAVRAFLGDSLLMRRSIFLGEANALAAPTPRLEAFMEIAREAIGALPVHAFLDALTGRKKSVEEYARLGALGLKRVSIGLESGHDPLLEFVQKPSSAADVAETVAALKQAGIAVSLIILIGLGGDRFAAGHVADTIALLNRLPLDAGDIIYFSTLVERARAPYSVRAAEAGIRPLDNAELHAQRQAIVAGLRFESPGPQIAMYDIHEFIY